MYTNVPWQAPMSHDSLCDESPGQGTPPNDGKGLEHVRETSLVPVPQVTEQLKDWAQEVQPPFTKCNDEYYREQMLFFFGKNVCDLPGEMEPSSRTKSGPTAVPIES